MADIFSKMNKVNLSIQGKFVIQSLNLSIHTHNAKLQLGRPIEEAFMFYYSGSIVVIQSLGQVQLLATPWTAACQASLPFTISWSLLKLMSIESVMPSNHLILCHPLLLLPSILPSLRVFSNELALCIRWPKYWSCSFSISSSDEYLGSISCRTDWFDILAVQWTLKNLLQHQFESINSLMLNLLYGPNLTSVHEYWKNHSFDYTDLCQQSDLCFLICCLDLS